MELHAMGLTNIGVRQDNIFLNSKQMQFWFPAAAAAAAAAAKSLESCPTLCDPIDGSPPGSPSLGFSRQEHWSGLPFPSPMHESEKWEGSRSVVSDPQRPHGLQPSRLLCPWDFPGSPHSNINKNWLRNTPKAKIVSWAFKRILIKTESLHGFLPD